MARVIWSPRAIADLEAIRTYIGLDSPLAAEKIAQRLKHAGDSLADFPERGRRASRNLRELAIIYPYLIRYRIVGAARKSFGLNTARGLCDHLT